MAIFFLYKSLLKRQRTAALACTGILFALVMGCPASRQSHPNPIAPIIIASAMLPALTPEEAARYSGDTACSGCHQSIAKQHAASGHSRTLQAVSPQDHSKLFKIAARLRDSTSDTTYRTVYRNGKCQMLTEGPVGKEETSAEFAVGSGRTGQTYLGRDHSNKWLVLRLSHYTKANVWDYTAQQHPDSFANFYSDPIGQPLSQEKLISCLACHVTTLQMAQNGPDLKRSLPGVGCERCHGPARLHVEAMSKRSNGTSTVTMEKLHAASPARIMEICGSCHDVDNSSASEATTDEGLARFQKAALQKSRCYLESRALSCISCHDPHSNAASDTHAYEMKCFNCHSGQTSEKLPSTNAKSTHPAICRINPLSGCIGCHMPVQTNPSYPHITFHNHLIKIWKHDTK